MATSGSYAWSLAGDDVITEAWERCGKNPEALNGAVLRSALRSAQLMLIHWMNRGLNLWQVDQQTTTLTSGVSTVATALATTDVLEVWVTDSSGVDRILAPISRDEYAAIPLKETLGPPTQFWCERVGSAPLLHLYPTPNAALGLSYSRVRLPQDWTSPLTTQPDAPTLWVEAVCAGLAAKLAVKFAPDRVALLAPLAEQAFQEAAAENRERVPLTLLPNLSRWR